MPNCEACGVPTSLPVYTFAPYALLCQVCQKLTLMQITEALLDRGIDVHARMPVIAG